MAKRPKQSRAYVCKVKNKKARTSSSAEYFQVYTEGGEAMLFTTNDLDKAAKRAQKNPEDVVTVTFEDPEPEVIIKEVIFEVPRKGFFTRLFSKLFKK
jgi:hypothetical protein